MLMAMLRKQCGQLVKSIRMKTTYLILFKGENIKFVFHMYTNPLHTCATHYYKFSLTHVNVEFSQVEVLPAIRSLKSEETQIRVSLSYSKLRGG